METLFPGQPVKWVNGDAGQQPPASGCRVTRRTDEQTGCACAAAVCVPSPIHPHGSNAYWNTGRRYMPRYGDLVVGIVSIRAQDVYRVDVNAAALGTLPILAFCNATKRHCPRLEKGSLVCCMVRAVYNSQEFELTCITTTDSKSWSSEEAYLGQLSCFGQLIELPIAFCVSLVGDSSRILDRFGKAWKFEVAIGLNGRVWINAPTPQQTLCIGMAFQALQRLRADQFDKAHIEAIVKFASSRAASLKADD